MTRPKLSFACPPGVRSVENSKIAEKLGYERAWLFDSPALYTDIWISLARIADATERIGLGTGVAVPSMRHPWLPHRPSRHWHPVASSWRSAPASRPGSRWGKSQ